MRGEHASFIRHFFFATLLIARRSGPERAQAIYAWCRELDETVDGVEALRALKEEADRKPSAIEAELRALFDDDRGGGPVVAPSSAPETIALADTIHARRASRRGRSWT